MRLPTAGDAWPGVVPGTPRGPAVLCGTGPVSQDVSLGIPAGLAGLTRGLAPPSCNPDFPCERRVAEQRNQISRMEIHLESAVVLVQLMFLKALVGLAHYEGRVTPVMIITSNTSACVTSPTSPTDARRARSPWHVVSGTRRRAGGKRPLSGSQANAEFSERTSTSVVRIAPLRACRLRWREPTC